MYVKEGQGAVLLCAPPPHYPGTPCVSVSAKMMCLTFFKHQTDKRAMEHIFFLLFLLTIHP